MSTDTIITNANDIVPNALKNLRTGVHILQVQNAPSTFPVTSAYGLLFSFGSLLNYHQFLYFDQNNMYWNAYTYTDDQWVGWQTVRTKYLDVNVTISSAGTAAQLNSSSGGVLSWEKFINGYVIGSNNIQARFHTYNNLLYVKLYSDTGSNAPAGTYKIRCWYTP